MIQSERSVMSLRHIIPLGLLTALTLSAVACAPTYQSVRAFVPHPDKAHKMQVEISTSQLDVGYAITDELVATAGASYLSSTPTENTVSTSEDNKVTYTEKSSQKGAHLGFGYYKSFGARKTTRISAIGGSAFQVWDYSYLAEQNDLNQVVESNRKRFSKFSASVINPFAQLAITQGSSLNNSSFALRFEKPIIDFGDAQPSTVKAQGSPTLMNLVFQGKYGLFGGLSAYTQFIYRHNFDTEHFNNLFDNADLANKNAYEISSWNLYFGLTYEFDFSDIAEDISGKGAAEEQGAAEGGERG